MKQEHTQMSEAKDRRAYLIILLTGILISILSIHSHSFWIDEVMRFKVASTPDFVVFLDFAASEKQFLFHALGRLWITVLGTDEICMRCINVPFYLLVLAYLVQIFKKINISPYWSLLIAVHPFTIYYLNEYSPYIALFSFILGMLYHAYFAKKVGSRMNALISQLYFICGYGLHFIFGFVGFLYLGLLLLRWKQTKSWTSIKEDVLAALILSPFYVAFTWMYLHYMAHGVDRGWAPPHLGNLLYVVYSFCGMQGLGLPRNDIRAGNFELFTPTMMSLLGLMLLGMLSLFILQFKTTLKALKSPIFISTMLACCIFSAASYIMHFHFWERHMVWFFPAFILIAIPLLSGAWKSTKLSFANKSVVILVLLLTLISSCRLRYYYNYQKEDYKGVIRWIQQHIPNNALDRVLTQGMCMVFDYYQVHTQEAVESLPELDSRSIISVENLNKDQLKSAIQNKLNEENEIFLILWEKNTCAPSVYKNTKQFFEQIEGISVTEEVRFNTFKVFTIKKVI